MSDATDQKSVEAVTVDKEVAEGNAYDVIKSRLVNQGVKLAECARNFNLERQQEFGSTDLSVLARVRVRTENNCIARDIVQVGNKMLFGYNVFIGLKKTTRISDVFALYDVDSTSEKPTIQEISLESSFLSSSTFTKEFEELYRYYKQAKLIQLSVRNSKLLMAFQIGERIEDIRVFRWAISSDQTTIEYIDNRGERDIQLPPCHDFEWGECSRDNIIQGARPYINILDTVFLEYIDGDLAIKLEDNTQVGRGIFREEVTNKTQSLDDGEYFFAKLNDLILLKVRPYQEDHFRYFIYNTLTNVVSRIDAVGASCVQLPEGHGIVFPGGYYLQSGECKQFNEEYKNLRFKRVIRSPNGEDVLFIFYEQIDGVVALFSYNMIDRTLQNPIYAHGYALSPDGTLVLFSAETEPTRVHPMQIWSTPFVNDEYASQQPESQTFFGRIGNAELVRGISDTYNLCRLIENQHVSAHVYEEIRLVSIKLFDDHYWMNDTSLNAWSVIIKEISETATLAIEEFDKVQSIQRESISRFREAEEKCRKVISSVLTSSFEKIEHYVDALDEMRHLRGHLATIKQYRYIDLNAVDGLDNDLQTQQNSLSEKTVSFLASEDALDPYRTQISVIDHDMKDVSTVSDIDPLIDRLELISKSLDLLSELLSSLQVSDATLRTRIIETISEIYAKLNQSKANAHHKKKNIGGEELVAEFSAQFKLFSQSIANGLGLARSPEKCDEQMSRLLVRLEEIETQFGTHEQFIGDIIGKRDEVYELFEAHKQQLLDEQQRKAQGIFDAAERAIVSIERRASKLSNQDDLNTFFASDPLVLKVLDFVSRLGALAASVKADDLDARFKAVRQQAVRVLRDKMDIYEEGGAVIKLGPRHRFSVNKQELDLTIIPRMGKLNLHLNGTDYFDEIGNTALDELKAYWDITVKSESPSVYRSEYLAYCILHEADTQSTSAIEAFASLILDDEAIRMKVSQYATPLYKEGYEKGIHDFDACQLLKSIVPALVSSDLLRFSPEVRGFSQVFWANIQRISEQLENKRLTYETWRERAQSAEQLKQLFHSSDAHKLLANEVRRAMHEFVQIHPMDIPEFSLSRAADYLVLELGRERLEFIGSKYAKELVEELKRSMTDESWNRFQLALEKMMGWPAERWHLSCTWLTALVAEKKLDHLSRYIPEAAALINADERIDRRFTEADLNLTVTGLMGEHVRINNRCMSFSLDEFLLRLDEHKEMHIPNFEKYLEVRQSEINSARNALRLSEFKARPLSSFVRNRLINEAYLPLIGDNLAKQIGTMGESKRSDLMGLLMMISPPGYGKTTLMEYVASRLGLIFMKINCPSLGHDVTSLDPEQAPNATAAQELKKLNLSLEMGNNVMLYLDDIQHTHPEFLQKFISLCDGTRRIEGIWNGETRTYDMRGKKFCVVMAGNPYTESGEIFRVPDMLANRADIYNLGDILGGKDEIFALSYIENSLTSNPVLSPLATRDLKDLYLFVDIAKGKEVTTTDFVHTYNGAEKKEIVDVLKKLFVVRDVVLKVNQHYIASAAQSDANRTEPPFKLQGSYRNMNKMVEKVSSVMNDTELMQLIADHYVGEAQLLTAGAEENLLKLAELRGDLSHEQADRWATIKENFVRQQTVGGADQDAGQKIVGQLLDLVKGIDGVAEAMDSLSTETRIQRTATTKLLKHQMDERQRAVKGKTDGAIALETSLLSMQNAITALTNETARNQTQVVAPNVEVVNQPVPGMGKLLGVMAKTIENSIYPLIRTMDKKLDIDLRTHDRLAEVSQQLRELQSELSVAPNSKKES